MTKKEAVKRIKSLLSDKVNNHGEAVLTTTSPDGKPHATWMGTLGSFQVSRILTMTSPDSRKVINILRNPNVEWMFTDEDREAVVYLRGMVRVIHDPDELETYWKRLIDKSRAYFMQYKAKPGMRFLILETKVEEAEYTIPRDNVYKMMKPPFG